MFFLVYYQICRIFTRHINFVRAPRTKIIMIITIYFVRGARTKTIMIITIYFVRAPRTKSLKNEESEMREITRDLKYAIKMEKIIVDGNHK